MSRKSQFVISLAAATIAVVALLWPMRAHHAQWAVTVGTNPDATQQTNYVAVGGGQLVTPVQLLIGGTAPKETATRSALKARVLTGEIAGIVALGAGIGSMRSRHDND